VVSIRSASAGSNRTLVPAIRCKLAALSTREKHKQESARDARKPDKSDGQQQIVTVHSGEFGSQVRRSVDLDQGKADLRTVRIWNSSLADGWKSPMKTKLRLVSYARAPEELRAANPRVSD